MSDLEPTKKFYGPKDKEQPGEFPFTHGIYKNMYSERFCRTWEFYLASCSAAFHYRDLLVYQLQIVKNYKAIPSNRRDYIYS